MLVHFLMYLRTYYIVFILMLFMFLVLLVLFAASVDLTTSLNVSFHQSKYGVSEKDQLLQPLLVLTEPSSNNITVLIKSIDITATGKYV